LTDRDPGSVHPTFDCSNPADHDQHFNHPDDCTRFIQCDNGKAWDKPCAACDQGNVAQCQGEAYTHFDRSVNATACIWPSDSTCKGVTPTTTPPTSTTPGTDKCDADCQVEGDCDGYRVCVKDNDNPDDNTGTWVPKQCSNGTYFEPRPKSHVPSCVRWDDLTPETKEQYLNDPKCKSFCEVTSLGPCNESYNFRDKGVTTTVRCTPSGYQYDEARKECVPADLCGI